MIVQPTKLTLITKQVISLKHFTAVYHSTKTFKTTIFLTILNICLDLPLMIHFYGRNKLTTVQLRTELPMCLRCGSQPYMWPEKPFAAGNWSRDLLLKFFRCLQFFYQKYCWCQIFGVSFLY